MWVRLGLKIGYDVDGVKSSRHRGLCCYVFASWYKSGGWGNVGEAYQTRPGHWMWDPGCPGN